MGKKSNFSDGGRGGGGGDGGGGGGGGGDGGGGSGGGSSFLCKTFPVMSAGLLEESFYEFNLFQISLFCPSISFAYCS